MARPATGMQHGAVFGRHAGGVGNVVDAGGQNVSRTGDLLGNVLLELTSGTFSLKPTTGDNSVGGAASPAKKSSQSGIATAAQRAASRKKGRNPAARIAGPRCGW